MLLWAAVGTGATGEDACGRGGPSDSRAQKAAEDPANWLGPVPTTVPSRTGLLPVSRGAQVAAAGSESRGRVPASLTRPEGPEGTWWPSGPAQVV